MEHQWLSGQMFRRLNDALEVAGCRHCRAFADVGWRISQDTVLRPDLVLVCDHPSSVHVEQTPSLVVEILSDSTRHRDLLYKRDMYEKLGVGYYLVIDPATSSWTLLKNGDKGFQETGPERLLLAKDCEISLSLEALFA
jgi:Uma2 family endonuclease